LSSGTAREIATAVLRPLSRFEPKGVVCSDGSGFLVGDCTVSGGVASCNSGPRDMDFGDKYPSKGSSEEVQCSSNSLVYVYDVAVSIG
jgi:hypothetical protein